MGNGGRNTDGKSGGGAEGLESKSFEQLVGAYVHADEEKARASEAFTSYVNAVVQGCFQPGAMRVESVVVVDKFEGSDHCLVVDLKMEDAACFDKDHADFDQFRAAGFSWDSSRSMGDRFTYLVPFSKLAEVEVVKPSPEAVAGVVGGLLEDVDAALAAAAALDLDAELPGGGAQEFTREEAVRIAGLAEVDDEPQGGVAASPSSEMMAGLSEGAVAKILDKVCHECTTSADGKWNVEGVVIEPTERLDAFWVRNLPLEQSGEGKSLVELLMGAGFEVEGAIDGSGTGSFKITMVQFGELFPESQGLFGDVKGDKAAVRTEGDGDFRGVRNHGFLDGAADAKDVDEALRAGETEGEGPASNDPDDIMAYIAHKLDF